MTKAARGPGSPIQLKNSLETLIPNAAAPGERKSAQIVVCEYVSAWHAEDSKEDQILIARELLDILGLLERR